MVCAERDSFYLFKIKRKRVESCSGMEKLQHLQNERLTNDDADRLFGNAKTQKRKHGFQDGDFIRVYVASLYVDRYSAKNASTSSSDVGDFSFAAKDSY